MPGYWYCEPPSGCGQDFGTRTAYERHQVGRGAKRRCLTVEELKNRGWSLDGRGRWRRSHQDASKRNYVTEERPSEGLGGLRLGVQAQRPWFPSRDGEGI